MFFRQMILDGFQAKNIENVNGTQDLPPHFENAINNFLIFDEPSPKGNDDEDDPDGRPPSDT